MAGGALGGRVSVVEVGGRFDVQRVDLRTQRRFFGSVVLLGRVGGGSDLWDRAFEEIAAEYDDITTDYAHVDAMCMWMVKNPEWFDVVVTDNTFGDIITDLGAIIQGGMGVATGGNINPEGVSMFEPIGGSAPKYTGKNVINPIAAICAAQMTLEVVGEEKAGEKIEKAVMKVLSQDLKSLSAGQMGYTTSEVGDLVAQYITEDGN